MDDLDALLDVLLARARRAAAQAEVYALEYRETPAHFEANRLKGLLTREGHGLALRVIKDGRIGYASTSRTDQLDDLVAMAVDTAAFGAQARFDVPRQAEYPPVITFDAAAEQLPAERLADMGQAVIDRVRAHTPDIQCEAEVVRRVSVVRIVNSAGLDVRWAKSLVRMSLEGTLVRGTDMLFVGDDRAACGPLDDWQGLAEETVRQLELARALVEAPAGTLPVILTPRAVASVFLRALTAALNGRTVLQGASPLGHRLGELVFDPALTVTDDPLLELRPGSRFADDEGVPARRITLIDRGRVGSFAYDLQTAGLAGTESTGSATRTVGSQPTPGLHQVRVAPGSAKLRAMLASVQDGLLVDSLLGSGQGNVLGGEFGANVLLGYRVQRGQVTGRVKNTMIAGNIYEAFREDVLVGDTPAWVRGVLEAPYLLCPRVAVSRGE